MASALVGGLVADVASPRLTYFLTVPVVLASITAFSGFREPRLRRAAEPVALRRHVATTATSGVGGYLAVRVNLGRRSVALAVAVLLAGAPVLFVVSHAVLVITATQTLLALALAVTGIHAGRLLHDAVVISLAPHRARISRCSR